MTDNQEPIKIPEDALVDSLRLRSALLLACIELTDGDPIAAWELAEDFYDMAPNLVEHLNEQGIKNLPGAPAEILQFRKKRP